MNDLQEKLAQAKTRYRQLRSDSQNPHTDPVLKSLEMAIARLEKQLQSKQS